MSLALIAQPGGFERRSNGQKRTEEAQERAEERERQVRRQEVAQRGGFGEGSWITCPLNRD